ncbi:Major Facilitator Superfamily [Rhizoctonia solani]|uniref:Major Facilitator Superfamily n=1 Tax=Rhizoctonia solani TaxID=456999 RepID=A0A8H7M419_9AGAM|nr:Major Facilitator Superfamily [Rhizoctonia solani]
MSFPPDAKSESPALHIEEKEITGSARYVTWLFRKNAKQTESYEINLIVELFLQLHSFIYFVTWTGKRQIAKQSKWNSLMQSLSLTNLQYTIALMASGSKLNHLSVQMNNRPPGFSHCIHILRSPLQLLSETLQPITMDCVLDVLMGALTISLGGVHSYGALTAVRFLLGTFEAGLFPGLVYFFTFWYRPEERSLRVALVLASSTLAGAFGGAIAYGVGFMNMTAGLEAWRWLFILEGIPSVLSSILVWFFFPDFPETAKWLSADERDRVVRRLEGIASTHSLSLFSPTIVAGLGYEGLDAQLFTVLSASSMAVGAFAFLAQALLPEKAFKARFAFLCVAASGSFGSIPPLLGWLSTNIRGAGAVGLAIAINISMGGTGQIIGVWIYKANEKPGYITGNLPCFD